MHVLVNGQLLAAATEGDENSFHMSDWALLFLEVQTSCEHDVVLGASVQLSLHEHNTYLHVEHVESRLVGIASKS